MRSQREDGRGHWPKGKRRNQDAGNWQRIRLSTHRLIENHWRHGKITYRALAAAVGVSDRTIRRYLAGEDRPPVELQEAIEQWALEWRDELKREAKR